MADDRNVTTQMTTVDDRAAKGWRMRVMGAPWAVIARELGYANEANVYRAVKNYFGTVPQVDRDMLRGNGSATRGAVVDAGLPAG